MNHELLALIEHEVLGWPGVVKESGSFDTAIYKLRRREIGHIHSDGVADLPFNEPLRLAVEQGLAGLAPFAVALGLAARRLWLAGRAASNHERSL